MTEGVSTELFVSYWRCNYSRKIRIMQQEEFSSPLTVAEVALLGDELTDEDVANAEAKLAELTGEVNSYDTRT